MKIGILTYYGVHNHGAVLQANALQSVLQGWGHNVKFLSFERSYEYIPTEQVNKYSISAKSIPYYFRFLKEKGIGNVYYNLQKSRTLKAFRDSKFQFEPYDQFDGDLTVVGSDEVFSLEIGYNPFMYGYGLRSKKTISYAGSFGPSTLEEIQKKKKDVAIREGLNGFAAISVRDQNSQNIVKNLCGKEAPLVCDPVLLYGYPKEQMTFKPNTDKYIAVYAYDHRMNTSDEVQAVKAYAKKHGLKVYSIAYYHKWCDRNINCDPIELLGWMKNAELVVTDTFHGSVLSIICNTPMAVLPRTSNEIKLYHLLNSYGLEERRMETMADLPRVAAASVDFKNVNEKVAEDRAYSMQYLQMALEG